MHYKIIFFVLSFHEKIKEKDIINLNIKFVFFNIIYFWRVWTIHLEKRKKRRKGEKNNKYKK